jgi:hypothetical protein
MRRRRSRTSGHEIEAYDASHAFATPHNGEDIVDLPPPAYAPPTEYQGSSVYSQNMRENQSDILSSQILREVATPSRENEDEGANRVPRNSGDVGSDLGESKY